MGEGYSIGVWYTRESTAHRFEVFLGVTLMLATVALEALIDMWRKGR